MTVTTTLPDDPTFPASAYARIALLLRAGVIGFLLVASVGLVAYLSQHPSESLASLLARGASLPSLRAFLHGLAVLDPTALILFGVYIMIAVTIARVLLAARDFAAGRERVLAAVSILVAALLLVGLFVVGPLVH